MGACEGRPLGGKDTVHLLRREKALAQKEQEKAKEEKRRRLQAQRMHRALECAKLKQGDCRTMDNKPIVCKVCRQFGLAEDILRNGRK